MVSYRLVGRSGLRVHPLSLGTMTFGTRWGWGADRDTARQIFEAYVERGGNLIDTAVNYTDGESECMVGELIAPRREQLILSTKYTLSRRPDDANSGGNHRLNMIRSVETSLRQLATDRIDLLYVHAWDFTTSPEEVMRGLDDLVRSGKVVYVGISNTPAWRIAQMQTLADLRGWTPLIALQVEYSLVQRTAEHELIPMAAELGLGIMPWSPLGGGVLTGKYTEEHLDHEASDSATGTRPGVIASSGNMTQRALGIADIVRSIATEVDATPAQVALAWVLQQPATTSPIIGARTLSQAVQNLEALDITLGDDHVARLSAASDPGAIFPAKFLARPMTRKLIFGETEIDFNRPTQRQPLSDIVVGGRYAEHGAR
ncbi:rhizopine catabolism protein [Mycolicibacterium canariasense]|uniref:Rhizopine catabolism protein n=1 Tax=Mycolicibacterium canariasense TaxID=228230 RepID=A0A100WGV0_MYCCR|nr:aldo/keto reductase [Mycolicibacterium canariasense]GAS98279.1 rhizopine catabolism protein [Mycolicibacterium canariasense]